ncbi:DUF559 domain-containing protein [Paenibacillus gansuensis]|uniref:DUF559 domain-containing protein n=1 Tax=Paenibacillus gansuensis TaxID=306542 RepID=A0ABW5PI64_9BACL
MHPLTEEFVQKMERQLTERGQYRNKLGKAEIIFLDELWGPLMKYNFTGLQAEYPFKDSKNGERFADYVYVRSGVRLVIEIDGYTTHARNLSIGDFEDHLSRQNELILSGWTILRFAATQVSRDPITCQRAISQAIGYSWSQAHGEISHNSGQLWEARRRLIILLASRNDGHIESRHLTQEFHITTRTATNWLRRFAQEGLLLPVAPNKRTTSYRLS